MTDEEVISKWMNEQTGSGNWFPQMLRLDTLHTVEARLSDEQWALYENHFARKDKPNAWYSTFRYRDLLHATAEQKIKALAAVIRAEGKP